MSGKHWLEREQKDSPGLQRIREAQQAADAAKARIALTEIQRKQNLESFRLKLIAQATTVEQRVAELKPLLEEARVFANKTGSFPISVDPAELVSRNGESLAKNRRLELIQPPTVKESKTIVAKGPSPRIDFQVGEICEKTLQGWNCTYDRWSGYNTVEPEPEITVELGHGYKGTIIETDNGSSYNDHASSYHEYDASIRYGIRIRVASDGKIKLLKQNLVNVTSRRGFGGSPLPDGKALKEDWITLPDDDQTRKQLLAEAFHNPAYLGAEKFYIPTETTTQLTEPQSNIGIADLVKGLLGFK